MEGWKNAGLQRTVTLGRAIALLTAPPLSYQAIRELLIFELVLHLPGTIWIVIDLTLHELLPYLHLLWVTKKKLGISQLPDGLIAQCVQRNRAVMGWSSGQDCFFFSVLCNCFSCFLNCNIIWTSIHNLSLLDIHEFWCIIYQNLFIDVI